MLFRYILVLLLIFTFTDSQPLNAQCIPIDHAELSNSPEGSSGVCPGQNINFTSPTTEGGASVEWDFCADDLQSVPKAEFFSNLPAFLGTLNPKVLRSGNNYYLFALGIASNDDNVSNLYRIDLGSNITNTPERIVNLGNGNSLIKKDAQALSFVEENGMWYGLVGNFHEGSLTRITFGSSLANTPIFSNIGTLGTFSNIAALTLIRDNNDTYAAIVDGERNKIEILNFKNTLRNVVTSNDIISSYNIVPNFRFARIEAIKDCQTWHIIAGIENNLLNLKYKEGLDALPELLDLSNSLKSFFPTSSYFPNIDILVEEGKYYIFIADDPSGKSLLCEYGTSLTNNSPNFRNLVFQPGSVVFPNNYGVSFIKFQGAWHGFITNYNNNTISKITFQRDCGVDPSVSIASSPQRIQYNKGGLHPVSLHVYNDQKDLIRVYTDSVNIKPTMVSDFSFTTNCSNTVNFINTSSGVSESNISSWQWNFGDGQSSTVKNPGTHTYNAPGNYEVTLSTVTNNGCSTSITKTIRISSGPTANFMEIMSACSNQEITFENTSQASNVPIKTVGGYYWEFGDDTYSPLASPKKTYSEPGTYTIKLTITDENGCQSVKTSNIQVIEAPVANFNLPIKPFCAQTSDTLKDASIGAIAWQWEIEGAGVYNEQNPVVTFKKEGIYKVHLKITSANNCTSQITKEVRVLPVPKIIFLTDKSSSNNLEVKFINQTIGATSFEWDFGDRNRDNVEANPTHIYKNPGEYIVTLKAFNENNCSTQISIPIEVGNLLRDLAVSEPFLDENGSLSVKIENLGNSLLSFFELHVQIGDSAIKELYEGTINPKDTIKYTFKTNFDASLIAGQLSTCIEAVLRVSQPDNNLSNNIACINLSGKLEVFTPYPNPATDLVTVPFSVPQTESPVEVLIHNHLGELISKSVLLQKDQKAFYWDVSNLPRGIYNLQVRLGDQRATHKILVR